MKAMLVLIPSVLLCGCVGVKWDDSICIEPTFQDLNERTRVEDKIREAVFRKMLPSRNSDIEAFFLSDENGDPSDELIHKLSDYPVFKGSECVGSSNLLDGVWHKITKKKGVILSISELCWVTDSKVYVKCCFYVHGLHAFGYNYVVQHGYKWRVTRVDRTWISMKPVGTRHHEYATSNQMLHQNRRPALPVWRRMSNRTLDSLPEPVASGGR